MSPFVADALGSLIALAIIVAGFPFYAVSVVYYEKLPCWYKNAVGKLVINLTSCNKLKLLKRL